MTRNGIRVVDLLDDFENFANKFSILADNHMAAFPGLQVSYIKIQYWYFILKEIILLTGLWIRIRIYFPSWVRIRIEKGKIQ